MGDFSATTDSLRTVAKNMEGGAIKTATDLRNLLKDLAGSTSPNDWSAVPSCQAFGSTYIAAIEAYQAAAQDMLDDATKMRDTLNDVALRYDNSDASARDDFNARMAALGGENYMTEKHDAAEGYDANKGDLHSDDPQQAPDQPQPAGHPSGQGQTQGGSGTTTTGGGGGGKSQVK